MLKIRFPLPTIRSLEECWKGPIKYQEVGCWESAIRIVFSVSGPYLTAKSDKFTVEDPDFMNEVGKWDPKSLYIKHFLSSHSVNHLSKMWGQGTKLRGHLGLRDEKWGLTPGEWPEGISSKRDQLLLRSQWLGIPLLQKTPKTHTQWSPPEIQSSIYTDQEKGNLPILPVQSISWKSESVTCGLDSMVLVYLRLPNCQQARATARKTCQGQRTSVTV